jgi:hypothetical protein
MRLLLLQLLRLLLLMFLRLLPRHHLLLLATTARGHVPAGPCEWKVCRKEQAGVNVRQVD